MKMAQVSNTDTADLLLLKDEAGGLMMEFGIATITFYKGETNKAQATLRNRLDLVVNANPWLAGRLVKNKGTNGLRYPMNPSKEDVDKLFKVSLEGDLTTIPNLASKPSPEKLYVQNCNEMYACKSVIVDNGYALVGADKPVTLLTISEHKANEFAVIFSISHAIADGRTYYEILNMLREGAEIRTLPSERVQSFSENMRSLCGRKELEWADKPSSQIMYTCAMMAAPPVKCMAFSLDAERIEHAKASCTNTEGIPYVSTNDIITSNFFTECDARIGMMGMDCRGKVEGVTQDMAGNYVTALTMDSETFGSPGLIRKMLSSTPYTTTKLPLPSFCGWLCGKDSAKFAMVTNWASFAGDLIQLEGCEMIVHLPVHNPAYCVYDLMVPFMSKPGQVAVMIWTISSNEENVRKAMPVGESVSSTLFPKTV